MHDIRLEMEKLERLTFKGNFCDIAQCRELSCPYGGSCSHKKVWERLKAYEETGLSPIACAQAAEDERLLSDAGVQLERIIEIVKADKDGCVVVLPCNDWLEVVFGDQVLFWGIDEDCIETPVREISVDDADRIGWYDGYKTVFLKGTDENGDVWEFSPADIGKTVFLTREEAEKALEVMKGG